MPIYQYKCFGCGAAFERMQEWNDDPVENCESCGGVVRKVISPVGVIFKGSGFHVTDYGRNKALAPEKEKAPPKTESKEGKSETKGESKSSSTDTKTDTKAKD